MTNHQQIKSGDFIEFNTKEHLQKEDIYKQCAKNAHFTCCRFCNR